MPKGRGRGRIFKPFVITPSDKNQQDEDFQTLDGAPSQKLTTSQSTIDFPTLSGSSSDATNDFPSLGCPPTKMPTSQSTFDFPALDTGLKYAAKAIPKEFEDVENTLLPAKESEPAAPVPQTMESKMSKMTITAPIESAPPQKESEQTKTSPPSSSNSSSQDQPELQQKQPSPSKSDKVRVLNGEFPAKRGRGTLGQKIQLRTNHFKMSLSKPLTIYQYDVEVEALYEKKRELGRDENKRECCKDKELMRDFFRKFCEKNLPVEYRNKVIFNFSKNMYSLIEFPFQDKLELVMSLDGNEFMIKIKPINTVKINIQNLDDPLTLSVLDLIMTNTFNYTSHIVNRSFFMPNCEYQQINFGLELWKGAYASVRPSECGLTWNVDSANTAFLTCVDLLEVAENHYQCRRGPELKNAIERDRDAKEIGVSFMKLFRGRKIKTQTGFRKKITSFGPDTNFKFPLKEDNKPEVQISIRDYLKKQYKITLQYPELPCINLGKTNYLPMELCKTELAHKKNLSEKETADIIRYTAIKATDRLNYIDKWVNSSSIVNDPVLKEYNVNLQFKMIELEGRVLTAPDIQYRSSAARSVVKSQDIGVKGSWDHRNLQFLNPKGLRKWVILNLSRSQKMVQLESELIYTGKSHGMLIEKACEIIERGNRISDRDVNNLLVDIIKKYHTKEAKLELIVVCLQGSASTYKIVKTVGDISHGVATQIVDEKTIFKLNGMTASNILLKINTKIHGRNFSLVSNPATNNLLKMYLKSFFEETMIFGADVTHPAPSQGDGCSESIAAVTGSLDKDCCYYAARLYAQRSPTGQAYEMIHDLDKMFKDLLHEYFRIHKNFPKRIIFFRDGVSEGQFSLVLRHEMNKIRAACQSISQGYKPAITFIIVQKRHHTRFLPVDPRWQSGKGANVPPGTVVDNTIVSENMFDYFLCSHAGIQGTSRPCRYYVLHDDNNLSTDQAQLLSHYLCHIYSRCARSVSYPAPAYYSHLAAFRGRSYIRREPPNLDKFKVTSYEIKLHDDLKNTMFYS